MLKIIIFLSTMCTSIFLSGSAQASDPNALLRVLVRDEHNKGLAGATVTLKGPVDRTMRATDGNGYTEENPPKGQYSVEASARGYQSQTRNVDLKELKTISFALIADKDKDRDQAANPNALLRVRVLDQNSKPIARAQVRLKRHQTGENRPMRLTDSGGYTEDNALRNDYEVEVSAEGFDDEYRDIQLNKQMTITFNLKKQSTNQANGNAREPSSNRVNSPAESSGESGAVR